MTTKIDGRENNKPPAANQFKKGQSGNPPGRPKKRPREYSEDQMYRDVLHAASTIVKVDLGQGRKKYTMQEAIIFRVMAKAANGDNGMIKTSIPLLENAYQRNQDYNRTVFDKLRRHHEMLRDMPDVRNEPGFVETLDHIRKFTKPI